MKLMCTEYNAADAFACMHTMHANIAIFAILLLFYVICAWQVADQILLGSCSAAYNPLFLFGLACGLVSPLISIHSWAYQILAKNRVINPFLMYFYRSLRSLIVIIPNPSEIGSKSYVARLTKFTKSGLVLLFVSLGLGFRELGLCLNEPEGKNTSALCF